MLAACARTPNRNLMIRTDAEPLQALLPGMDVQKCAWADIRSGDRLAGMMMPDAYIFGVIALSDQQVQDITTAFAWMVPEFPNVEEDQLYLAEKYFGVKNPSQMHLVVSSAFDEQNASKHCRVLLAEKEQLLLFVYVTM